MARKPLTLNAGKLEQLPDGAVLNVGGWYLPATGGTPNFVMVAGGGGQAAWSDALSITSVTATTVNVTNLNVAGWTEDYVLTSDASGKAIWSTDLSITTLAISGGVSTVDYIQFDVTYADGVEEGRLQWNIDDGTLQVGMPGGNVNLQIGQEQLVRCRNTTGSTIPNGSAIYIIGQSGGKPLIALSRADVKATAIVFGVTTESIDHNSNGYVTTFGLVRDINTTGFSEGGFMFLSATTPGGMETFPATAPSFKARVGYCLAVHAENGVMLCTPAVANRLSSLSDVEAGPGLDGEHLKWSDASQTWVFSPTHEDFWNGTFRESFDALVTSDGATVTLSLEQSGGGDLTMKFSDAETILDCTDPVQTIELTAGDDANPQGNYVYILQSGKVLVKDTNDWPSTEHIKIGYFLVPSATFVNDHDGVYVNQNWNDHLSGTDNQGHMSHMAQKLRQLGASWYSGVNADGVTDSYFTIGAGSTLWRSTAGLISQLHPQNFPVVDMALGDLALVVNDSISAYTHIADLFDIDADNTGTTITNNRYFNLVFWGVANKGGELTSLMVNLPGGFYTLAASASIDADGYDVYDIPREFSIESGTAFLIARATFQMGSTWSHVATVDLRGKSPYNAASGSSVNDHGGLGGLGDDDHTQYHTDARAATWLAANHETTYNHANYDTAYGWGNHASGGYVKADGTVPLTAAWDAGTFGITTTGTVVGSNIPAPTVAQQVLISTAADVAAWSTAGDEEVLRSNGDGEVAWTPIDWPRVLTGNETVYVTKAGNDSTGDGSVGTPYLTIGRAITHIGGLWIGSTNTFTVEIGAGVFTESTLALKHPFGANVVFNGVDSDDTASAAVTNITAASAYVSGVEYYDFDLTLTGKTAAVGDFIIVRTATGGTYPEMCLGCHEVIAWNGGTEKATVRCYIRASIGGILPSGAVTCAVSTMTTIIYSTSDVVKLDGPYHCGNWNDLVFTGDDGDKGVWMLNGATIVIGQGGYVGTSGHDINIYAQNGSVVYADGTFNSKSVNQLCKTQNSSTINLRDAFMTGGRNQAIYAFISSSVQCSGITVIGTGSTGILAYQQAFVNATNAVLSHGKATGSQAYYAATGGGIDATGSTVTGYAADKSPATNPGNDEAYIVGP